MKKFFVSLSMALSVGHVAAANLIPVEYATELCSCTAKVDTSKMSLNAVKNALDLPSRSFETLSWTQYSQYSPAVLKEHRERHIREHNELVAKIAKLELPKFPEWEVIRRQMLNEVEFDSQKYVKTLTYLESRNADVLLSDSKNVKIPAQCKSYAASLKSDMDALNTHKRLFAERCKSNAMPSACEARANESRKNILIAKSEVLAFGWENCVNYTRPESYDNMYLEAREQLGARLVDHKCECDEP
jgi:hypothetical protein